MTIHPDQETELWFNVIHSDYYQQMQAPLFDLFCSTRTANGDPQAIFDIQLEACAMLLSFQDAREEYEHEQDVIGVAIAKRLIHILKQILDSLAWRVFDFDRKKLQVLTDHHKTGYIDDTVRKDLALAQVVTEQYEAIILVNDLTNLLLYGDLTILMNGDSDIHETKYGGATKKNRRATRQRKNLEQLQQFLKMGVRSRTDGRDFLFQTSTSVQSYHSVIAECIKSVKGSEHGYCRRRLSDCLAIDVVWLFAPNPAPLELPLFAREEHVIRFSNIDILYQPIQRVAPYGIFPFDEQSCFDLITGEIAIHAALNLRQLQDDYRKYGLELELYDPITPDEKNAYVSASIGEKKKLLSRYDLTVRDGRYTLPCSRAHFCPIFVEFLCEATLVESDRQRINLLKTSNITDGTTGFYVGYGNEKQLWR